MFEHLQEIGTVTWLADTPNFACGIVLHPVEFRDELRDRYGVELLDLPSNCDSCDEKISASHALGYKVDSLTSSHHDEGRDALVCLFESTGFMPSNVRDEYLIYPCHDLKGISTYRLLIDKNSSVTVEVNSNCGDVLIRGFWERNTD